MLVLTEPVLDQPLFVGFGLVTIAFLVLAAPAIYGAFKSRTDPGFRSSYDKNPRRVNIGLALLAGSWVVLGVLGLVSNEEAAGMTFLTLALLPIFALVARRRKK